MADAPGAAMIPELTAAADREHAAGGSGSKKQWEATREAWVAPRPATPPGAPTAESINIPAHVQVPEDFPSISVAIDMAADGDVILIAPGEYRESITLSKDVTLMGHRGTPQECVIISKNATTVTFCARRGMLKNLSLRVEDTSNFFHCLVVENGQVEMDSCELSGGAWGICINNRASATVRACQIHDNKGTGVNVYGGARLSLVESEVCSNRGRGISVSDSGTSVVLTGNLIHHCSDGVYVYGRASLRMEENYVHSNQDSGVTVHESGTSAVIKRNYMQRNGWGGVRIYSGAGADVQDNDLQGNQSGPMAIDKASQAVVVVDNNQTADALPTGSRPCAMITCTCVCRRARTNALVLLAWARRACCQAVAQCGKGKVPFSAAHSCLHFSEGLLTAV
jgi:parallel beta-helix repeat protein